MEEIIRVIIISTIIIGILVASLILNIIDGRRRINLFDENEINKIKNYNYQYFKIKRRRGTIRDHGTAFESISDKCPLEAEIPVPNMVIQPTDEIGVFGIENNKEYLIFGTEWTLNDAKRIKKIVDKLNEELKTETD